MPGPSKREPPFFCGRVYAEGSSHMQPPSGGGKFKALNVMGARSSSVRPQSTCLFGLASRYGRPSTTRQEKIFAPS